jgi:hypothetical protein
MLAVPALFQRPLRGDLRNTAVLAWVITILLLTLYFFVGYDGTPGEFGFRFMLPAIPFLMLLVPLTFRWSKRFVVPILALASLAILAKGQMFGSNETRDFWGDYGRDFGKFGISTYTLSNIKQHIAPKLSPLLITAIQLAILGIAFAIIRFGIWRREPQMIKSFLPTGSPPTNEESPSKYGD